MNDFFNDLKDVGTFEYFVNKLRKCLINKENSVKLELVPNERDEMIIDNDIQDTIICATSNWKSSSDLEESVEVRSMISSQPAIVELQTKKRKFTNTEVNNISVRRHTTKRTKV